MSPLARASRSQDGLQMPALAQNCTDVLPRFSLAAIAEVVFRTAFGIFIFLRPFAPPALPGFFATTASADFSPALTG